MSLGHWTSRYSLNRAIIVVGYVVRQESDAANVSECLAARRDHSRYSGC